eukprot:2652792-Rhodomonas_salina.2
MCIRDSNRAASASFRSASLAIGTGAASFLCPQKADKEILLPVPNCQEFGFPRTFAFAVQFVPARGRHPGRQPLDQNRHQAEQTPSQP